MLMPKTSYVGAFFLVAALLGAAASPVAAIDTVAVEVGVTEYEDMTLGRVILGWELERPPSWAAGWPLTWSWEARLGYWESDNSDVRNRTVSEVGVAPVVRWEARTSALRPYLEAGIGLHLLSDSVIGNRDLGSDYHFTSHLGLGLVGRSGTRLGIRLQHLSNAGLERPNQGINSAAIHLAVPLR